MGRRLSGPFRSNLRAGRSEPWGFRPGMAVLEWPGIREAQAYAVISCVFGSGWLSGGVRGFWVLISGACLMTGGVRYRSSNLAFQSMVTSWFFRKE